MLYNLLEGSTKTNPMGSTILFIVIFVLLIGLMIWQTVSGKKKQKEAQNMVDALKKGDRVKTIGGICGFVVEINNEENTFVLETGTETQKSYVKFDKGAIYQTAPHEGSAAAKEAQEKAEAKVEEKAEEKVEEPAKAPKKSKKVKKAEAPVEEKVEEPKAE